MKRDKERRKWKRQWRDTQWRLPTESITEALSAEAEARLSYLVSVEISISSASPWGPRGSRLQLTWLKHPSSRPTRRHEPHKQPVRTERAGPDVCQNESCSGPAGVCSWLIHMTWMEEEGRIKKWGRKIHLIREILSCETIYIYMKHPIWIWFIDKL